MALDFTVLEQIRVGEVRDNLVIDGYYQVVEGPFARYTESHQYQVFARTLDGLREQFLRELKRELEFEFGIVDSEVEWTATFIHRDPPILRLADVEITQGEGSTCTAQDTEAGTAA